MNGLNRRLIRMLVPACVIAAATGCKSLVDLKETPQTFVAPSTYFKTNDQAITAMNGVYALLMTWDNWINPAWGENMCEEPDIHCPDWVVKPEGVSAGAQQWWTGRTWTANFGIVRRANDILGQLDKISLDAQLEERLRGEAHFLRAFAYFELVKRYGAVPLHTEAYVPDGTFGDAPRAPLLDVYKQIAADFTAAGKELPVDYASKTYTSADRGRPTQAAANGMLARVYLTMAGAQVNAGAAYFDSAKAAAQRVMNVSWVKLEPDFMTNFRVATQLTSNENLYQVLAFNKENMGPQLPTYFPPPDFSQGGGGAGGFVWMRHAFYQTYDTINDLRVKPGYAIYDKWKESYSSTDPGTLTFFQNSQPDSVRNNVSWQNQNGWTWTSVCETNGQNRYKLASGNNVKVAEQVYTKKYTETQALTKSSNLTSVKILRFADVLLMFAEAENEVNGPTAAAQAAINQVRNRAGLANLSGADIASKVSFRQAVWLERRHELYGEFQTENDLKREGLWYDYMNDVKPAFPGAPNPSAKVCRPRQAYQNLLPIPAAELQTNTKISQNPGY